MVKPTIDHMWTLFDISNVFGDKGLRIWNEYYVDMGPELSFVGSYTPSAFERIWWSLPGEEVHINLYGTNAPGSERSQFGEEQRAWLEKHVGKKGIDWSWRVTQNWMERDFDNAESSVIICKFAPHQAKLATAWRLLVSDRIRYV